MFTKTEVAEAMALIHAAVCWQGACDTPEDYEAGTNALHTAADGLSQSTIMKLIAAINMKTMTAIN